MLMKALTLHQPFASLIAHGVKTVETRSWAPSPTVIGQRIAIHAARKKPNIEDLRIMDDLESLPYGFKWNYYNGMVPKPYVEATLSMPKGAVVATARLEAVMLVLSVGTFAPNHLEFNDGVIRAFCNRLGYGGEYTDWLPVDEYGDFRPGRWLWVLADVRRVSPPIGVKGKQRLWGWYSEHLLEGRETSIL